MSELTELQEIASNIRARLVEITKKRKPSYDIDGQKVSWAEYHKMLMDQLKATNEMINTIDPFEHVTQGFT